MLKPSWEYAKGDQGVGAKITSKCMMLCFLFLKIGTRECRVLGRNWAPGIQKLGVVNSVKPHPPGLKYHFSDDTCHD
jgi:hypothetical protein